MSKIVALIVFFFSLNAGASNRLVLMGAGGEPERPDTIFDSNLKNLTKLVDNSEWDSYVSVNGGHKKTEKILESYKRSKNIGEFSLKNYNDLIQMQMDDILSGKIKKDDQVLIYIDTHGYIREDENQKGHTIAAVNGEDVDLDSLQRLINLAHEHGVKLAIADMSCHSGSTLDLNIDSKNICLISATSRTNFAYADFAENFSTKLVKGTNLETAFLEARRESSSAAYPMINGDVGLAVQSMSGEIDKIFFDNSSDPLDESSQKLNDHIEEFMSLNNQCIKYPLPYSLLGAIDSAQSLLSLSQKINEQTLLNLEVLKELTYKRSALIDELISIKREIGPIKNKMVDLKNKYGEYQLNYHALAMTDYDSWRKDSEIKLSNEHISNEEREIALEEVQFYTDAAKLKDSLKKSDEFRAFKKKADRIFEISNEIGEIANGVSRAERDLYDILYKNESVKQDGNNPCRDFVI